MIGPDWQVREEIEFTRLAKLRLEVDVEDVMDVLSFLSESNLVQSLIIPPSLTSALNPGTYRASYGFLYEYDRAYDRINTKNPQPLQILDRSRYHPTASEDPIMQDLASRDKARVFTTDSVLSLLMCATRSVYPWDIVLTKEGDKLFMDKREGGPFGESPSTCIITSLR